MRPGQEAIYTITGDNLDLVEEEPAARRLPRARRRGIAADRPDRRILGASVGTYKEKPFKSATRGGVDLDKIAAPEDKKEPRPKPEPPAKLASLIAIFKLALGDAVKDVRSSERLTDSAVCLVADEGDIDMHLERLLKAAPPARHRREAHPRTEPAPPADRAPRRLGRRDRRVGASCRNSPGCCSIRRASSRASNCPTPPPSPAASRCCSNAACRRRRERSGLLAGWAGIAKPRRRVSAGGSAGCRRRSAECRRAAASPAARSTTDAR